MKKRFSEEQIIGFLKEADAGMPVVELCRKHGLEPAPELLLPDAEAETEGANRRAIASGTTHLKHLISGS